MKTLRTLTPVVLGLLTLAVASSVNAQVVIDTLDNGDLSVTGMTPGKGCTVLFNPQGELLQNGRSCSSREIGKAQAAIDTYLREQGTSDRHNANSSSQRLTLICYGQGRRPSVENRYAYEWDEDRDRYVTRNRIESTTEEFDSDVQVDIRGTEGRIHLSRKLISPLHSGGDEGWWKLNNLKVSPDQITGRYRMNLLNKPRVTIDRRSGRLTIDGTRDFRGECHSGDWGSSRNRF